MSQSTITPPEQQIPARPEAGSPLGNGLKQRHLSMIALGGVIGAGLFVGSGAGIGIAGPAIILSYLLAG
ncbi:amino acid transporter, partial [Streptomyces sp. NPDC059956]